ncbi:MAG: HAMP domain-containing sensor histidine kinase, partial [Acidimicrobiales bacterium]
MAAKPRPSPAERRSTDNRTTTAAVLSVGGIASFALGVGLGLPVADAVGLAAIATAGALVVGVAATRIAGRFDGPPIRDPIQVVVVVGVLSIMAGVLLAARAMFISEHDLRALFVVLFAAGSAAVAAALHLGSRVGAASRGVEELTLSIGNGRAPVPTAVPPTAELARLATRIREVSAELETTRQREHALESSRRELVAWVSHDLRAPLAGIRAMAEALADGIVEDSETVDRYHHQLRTEADHLAALVEDLFELSRVTSGTAVLHLERVPLDGLVAEAVGGAQARAEQAGVQLAHRVEGRPQVHVSMPEFARAMHNLLDNAIRHTPRGGRVRV